MAKKESLEEKKKRARKIFRRLKKEHPDACCALDRSTPLDLLVATILSAQCTDVRVNIVTKSLFQKCKTPHDYLKMSQEQLEHEIRSTGFFRNKSKSIKGCCQGLLDIYGGEVPKTIEALTKLPGVGRKTANCVLGAAYGIPGVVVDTHVKRLSLRLGLTENKDPDKIEMDLVKLLPKERWRRFSDILIYHGRAVCTARKPKHNQCPIFKICPSNSL